MTRASISISASNDEWIQTQIKSKKFSSCSEVVNDLIRRARKESNELQAIRTALIEGLNSGTSNKTPDEIISAVLERRRNNGSL